MSSDLSRTYSVSDEFIQDPSKLLLSSEVLAEVSVNSMTNKHKIQTIESHTRKGKLLEIMEIIKLKPFIIL